MDREAIERAEHILWIWTLGEVSLLAWVGWLLVRSLVWNAGVLVGLSRSLRLVGLAFVVFQLLVPLAVYLDVRRREEGPGMLWVHVAAMPVLNVFGLVGYVEARGRPTGE